MNHPLPRAMLVVLTCIILSLNAALGHGDEAADGELLFAVEVLPVLRDKCFACHGEMVDDMKGELDVTSRAGLLKGGESGQPALQVGQPAESLLIQAVRWDGLEMPPKQNDRLTAAQIDALTRWVAAGAPWPDEARVEELVKRHRAQWDAEAGVAVSTSGGLTNDWTQRHYQPEDLWAYQPIAAPALGDHAGNPIDFFIGQGLQRRDLQPAPACDRRTLIRRVTFDLIGLPPTPQEVEAFVADNSSDESALRKLIDRLLASPHYGEQWGRHWLDVVRYADSAGFANDYERGNAWRYRDYVVRSFNEDKPYDQFIRQQLAGDEMNPDNAEMLIATGLLRMGPWELTGMEVAKIARQRFLDDVTNAVGQIFLAHPLRCARCHDHKFDPVPTRDYYAMQAVFATTQLAERPAEFLEVENTKGFDEKQYLLQRREFYNQLLRQLDQRSIEAARAWYVENQIDAAPFEAAVNKKTGYAQIRAQLRGQGIPEDRIPPRHAGFTPRDYGLERVARKGLERLRWRLERYEPVALTVYPGRTPLLKSVYQPLRMPENRLKSGELERTCILVGGDPFSPQDPVSPSGLSAVNGFSPELAMIEFPTEIIGRRRALAQWISSCHNPLTARVMVNRLWQWHFGKPLAGNPNNFGATGKKPTHPELLDWLAASFMQQGWSVKAMHRIIMTSQAYRRSTQHPDPTVLADRDPNREAYAVFLPRRLDAEELRDAMLSASGELNRQLGGIPVRPEMNLEAALQPRMVMGTFAEAWQPSVLPAQRHRRSLYALRLRGQRDPFLEVFNAPGSELSCEAREASTVTPQVFAMFNSEIGFDRALALAHRVTKETDSREAAINLLFRLTYGRSAETSEVETCLGHWSTMTGRHQQIEFEPPDYPTEVVREAVEENTGVRFRFVEPLEFYVDFVPDMKPADASPELRGLAEVCLVILNSNEFVYVY